MQVEWRQGKDMPFGMHYNPQAIVLKGKVYLGGGKSERSKQVLVYEPKQELWAFLPPYKYELFSMTIVDNQLVLVGGEDGGTLRKTNLLGVWNKSLCAWTHPFSPMLNARSSPTVVTYENKWLITIGGRGEEGELFTVEVMDISSDVWYSAPSLSIPAERMSAAVIKNTMIVFGGSSGSKNSKKVFMVNMDDLIWQAITQKNNAPAQSPWQALPDTPFSQSTAVLFNGVLLAVGGQGATSFHFYHPESRSWVKAGDLPTERVQCASTVLPNGEVLLAGGENTHKTVEMLTFLSN